MDERCVDAEFGSMVYRHRWVKTEKISFFGKDFEVKVVALAYSNKPINDQQRESHKIVYGKLNYYIGMIGNIILEYIKSNRDYINQYYSGIPNEVSLKEISGFVSPHSIVFKNDGAVVVLLDCVWDLEHGLSVKIVPEVELGLQDAFI